MSCKVIFLILASLSIEVAYSQTSGTISACPEDSVKAWLKALHVPAVGIGIIEHGGIRSIKVYGEIRQGVVAPVNTIWAVASLTKPVFAAIVLALVDKGLLDLDEPVSKYWIDPDIAGNPFALKLTARILLSHRSGFKNWRALEPDKKLAFHFEPGTAFGYSGEGYEYLRMAIEKKFGRSIRQIADEQLFVSAKMKETRFGWDDTIDSVRFAEAYNERYEAYPFTSKMTTHTTRQKQANAANWLLTTVEDYCRFGVYILKGAGISKQTYAKMTTIHSQFDPNVPVSGMGLGWQVVKDLPNGEFVLTHNGSNKGVATIVVLFPRSQRGIVIFTNGDDGAKVVSRILKNSKIDLEPYLKNISKDSTELVQGSKPAPMKRLV